LTVARDGRLWVMELKTAGNDDDKAKAREALKRAREKARAAPYDAPILIGFAATE
jgi:hypothetical protein